MVTLIAVYNSEGLVGRCDARCYNAKGQDCTCICHGSNHAQGKDTALENTQQLWEDWGKEAAIAQRTNTGKLITHYNLAQAALQLTFYPTP
jgi:hypothetical protein